MHHVEPICSNYLSSEHTTTPGRKCEKSSLEWEPRTWLPVTAAGETAFSPQRLCFQHPGLPPHSVTSLVEEGEDYLSGKFREKNLAGMVHPFTLLSGTHLSASCFFLTLGFCAFTIRPQAPGMEPGGSTDTYGWEDGSPSSRAHYSEDLSTAILSHIFPIAVISLIFLSPSTKPLHLSLRWFQVWVSECHWFSLSPHRNPRSIINMWKDIKILASYVLKDSRLTWSIWLNISKDKRHVLIFLLFEASYIHT